MTRLVATIIEAPCEWLPQLPGEWKCEGVVKSTGNIRYWSHLDNVLFWLDSPTTRDTSDLLFRVHVPAGSGLPMELAPKEAFVWIQSQMEGGFPVCVTWDENGYWRSFRSAGRAVDERMKLTAWLPLPGGAE